MTPRDVRMLNVDDARRCTLGVLQVVREAKSIALPLSRVDLKARVAGRVAQISVVQAFRNPYAEPLEAVYIFPLPGGCAVSDFELRVAGRTVKGVVQERGEARRQYQKAIQDGKRAALLEQERDDVFTVQVGNLPPGEEAEVRMTLSQKLPYFDDGFTELRLPTVVAPRYIPGDAVDGDSTGDGTAPDSDRVPDASRITPPRLAEGVDPDVAFGIEVEMAGADVEELACSQHATKVSAGGGVKVTLAHKDDLMDRDFVLRWRLAGAAVTATLVVHKAEDGALTGLLSMLPPKRDGFLGLARDVVFVLDRSGSMEGVKMASAARACGLLLSTLGPRDRFALQAFDDRVDWMPTDGPDKFVAADDAGLDRGQKWLRTIESRGGTELDGAVAEALRAIRLRGETPDRAAVVVVLTDGQVGNESEILARLQGELGEARVFTVGIDTAVNEGFLKRLAAIGGGTSSFVVPGDALEEALQAVGREIGEPVVTALTVDGVEDIAPARVPDLFAGRASTVSFRLKTGWFSGGRPKKVVVRGRLAGGKPFEAVVEPEIVDLPAIAHLWARARVSDLEDRFRLDERHRDAIRREIVELAVKHTLLTRFTAFVAVDPEVVNAGGQNRHVVQPVHQPDRWEMDKQKISGGKVGSRGAAGGGFAASCKSSIDDVFADSAEIGAPPAGAPIAPPPPPAPCAVPAPVARPKKAPREMRPAFDPASIAAPVGALFKALEEVRRELEAGRVPPADALASARQKLMDVLSTIAGAVLPSLQRLLRLALLEVLAALRSGARAEDILRVLDRHAALLAEARAEAAGKSGAPFWEATV